MNYYVGNLNLENRIPHMNSGNTFREKETYWVLV